MKIEDRIKRLKKIIAKLRRENYEYYLDLATIEYISTERNVKEFASGSIRKEDAKRKKRK